MCVYVCVGVHLCVWIHTRAQLSFSYSLEVEKDLYFKENSERQNVIQMRKKKKLKNSKFGYSLLRNTQLALLVSVCVCLE